MLTKIAMGLGVALAIAAPTCYVVGNAKKAIRYTTIAENSTESYATDKLGDNFKHHFVSAKEEKNEKWWWHVYSAFEKEKAKTENSTISTEFSKVDKHYSTTDAHALNKVCEDAYGKAVSDIYDDSDENHAKAKYLSNIWTYCSLERELPVNLEEVADYKEDNKKIGGKKKKRLVSTKGNDKFWEVQEKVFFGKKKGFGEAEGAGNSATNEKGFKELYDAATPESVGTLRAKCEEMYRVEEDSDVSR